MPLEFLRQLAIECGLKNLHNGHDEHSFGYRDCRNRLWFIYLIGADVIVRRHLVLLVSTNGKFEHKSVFQDKYQVSLYEPESIQDVRLIFDWLLRGIPCEQ